MSDVARAYLPPLQAARSCGDLIRRQHTFDTSQLSTLNLNGRFKELHMLSQCRNCKRDYHCKCCSKCAHSALCYSPVSTHVIIVQ
jgi:hypothetical protein